jgi:hypothetical protein
MNIEFKKEVICGFFGFLTVLFTLGFVPSLTRFVYKCNEGFRRRLLVPVVAAFIAGLVFVLPVGVTDVLLAFVGVVFVVWHFVRPNRKAERDVV